MPIFIPIFYLIYFNKLEDEHFDDTYGCVYEGLKVESRWALVYPIVFVARRSLLVVLAIYFYNFIWLQVVTQLIFSMFMVAYVYILWPFKDDTQNKLDMFNELSTMMLIYFAYMFTDLCPSAED